MNRRIIKSQPARPGELLCLFGFGSAGLGAHSVAGTRIRNRVVRDPGTEPGSARGASRGAPESAPPGAGAGGGGDFSQRGRCDAEPVGSPQQRWGLRSGRPAWAASVPVHSRHDVTDVDASQDAPNITLGMDAYWVERRNNGMLKPQGRANNLVLLAVGAGLLGMAALSGALGFASRPGAGQRAGCGRCRGVRCQFRRARRPADLGSTWCGRTGTPCQLDLNEMQLVHGSLVPSTRRRARSSHAYRLHWAGLHSSAGSGDCGASADIVASDGVMATLLAATGGVGVGPGKQVLPVYLGFSTRLARGSRSRPTISDAAALKFRPVPVNRPAWSIGRNVSWR